MMLFSKVDPNYSEIKAPCIKQFTVNIYIIERLELTISFNKCYLYKMLSKKKCGGVTKISAQFTYISATKCTVVYFCLLILKLKLSL